MRHGRIFVNIILSNISSFILYNYELWLAHWFSTNPAETRTIELAGISKTATLPFQRCP